MTVDAMQAGIGGALRASLRDYAMFLALVVVALLFAYLTDGVFLSVRNLSNLLLQTAAVAIVAMGMVLVIVSGNIDLSIGSLIGAVGAMIGAAQLGYGLGAVESVAIGLAFGLAVGCWHGYWIAYRNVPSIIVTLASMLILRGAAVAITQGKTLAPLDPAFLLIGQSYLPSLGLFGNDTTAAAAVLALAVLVVGHRRQTRRREGNEARASATGQLARIVLIATLILLASAVLIAYRGLPTAVLVVALVGLGLAFVGNRTVFGRQIYAIGGNRQAAAFSGVDVRRRVFMLFVLMGGVGAVSAVVFAARVGSASAAAGSMMELDAIAAAIIGGTSLAGGIGTIAGALVGALIMTALDNGMSLMNLDASYQLFVKGMILLLAVWFDTAQKARSGTA